MVLPKIIIKYIALRDLKRFFAFSFSILVLGHISFSENYQQKVDSLRKLLIASSEAAMYADAIELANKIGIMALEQNDSRTYIISQVDKIEILRAMGDLKIGLEAVKETKEYQQQQKFKELNPLLLNREAAILYELSDFTRSIKQAKESIKNNQQLTKKGLQVSNLILLSANYREMKNYDSSEYYIRIAIKQAIENKDTSNLVLAYYNAANIKKSTQNYTL